MLDHTQRHPSTLAPAYRRFIPSIYWKSIDSSAKADPLAIVEASLTSVKYAFYQVLGHNTLHLLGYHYRNATAMTSVSCGFIGGAVFTVPYLILLPMDSQTREDFGSFGQQVIVVGKEMMFSAFAGGVGMLVLDGFNWSGRGVIGSVAQGMLGPFVSFALLHAALKIVLWSVWIFMSKNPGTAIAQ